MDESLKNTETSPHPSELREIDCIVIEIGLKKLWELFSRLETSELPDVLVFPDASARPLAYPVKALATRQYEARGAQPPFITFFQSNRLFGEAERYALEAYLEDEPAQKHAELTRAIQQDDLSLSEISELLDELNAVEAELDEQAQHSPKEQDQRTAETREWLERKRQYEQSRLPMHQRAAEILKATHARRILIIDEFRLEGTNVERIKEAFSQASKERAVAEPVVRDFAFVSAGIDRRTDPYSYGVTQDELTETGMTHNAETWFSSLYDGKDQIPLTGVTKDLESPHVKRASGSNLQRMRAFRSELEDIQRKLERAPLSLSSYDARHTQIDDLVDASSPLS